MSKIVYDQNLLKFMSVFESMTHARVKDCLQAHLIDAKSEFDLVLFIVEPGDMGKAIGPKGVNVHRLEDLLKKRVKMVQWAPEVTEFVQNLIYPAKVSHIEVQDNIITISPLDLQSRGMIIGRNAGNLHFFEDVVRRHFQCEHIKVLGG